MRLSAGEKLGPYEVVELIGRGGMGEVYRGTDTRLGRSVAIKVSSQDFNDRFEREARAISALNHPNICTLYDVGPNYLVMEFVEGESLATLVGRGPLPLDKALTYAIQIADALAAAHQRGIVHRDLKPGNIMITANGVKVLDFGLARFNVPAHSSASIANMPTIQEPVTEAGSVVGTLYYMAPEQAGGKEADARSDIFSFGVVLYEMVTGQRAFNGDSQAEVMASLLRDQPPSMSLRQPVPRALERIVKQCIEKKPEDRWNSAKDLKRALELIDLDAAPPASSTASVPVTPVAAPAKRRWLWPAIAVAAALLAAGTAWTFRPKAAPTRATRFTVSLPDNITFNEYVSVSPDGHKLLFTATGEKSGIWIHDLDTLEWRRLEGTDNAVAPFWSPDSRYLGFAVGNALRKVEVAGGPPETLCTVSAPVGTGTWNRDGVILFGGRPTGPIRKVSSAGGVPVDITNIDTARGEAIHGLPAFLPDGKHFLYLQRGSKSEITGVYVGSLDLKPADQPRERILNTITAPKFADGNVFFMRDGTLMVQPFDTGKLRLTGEPIPLAEHVGTAGNGFTGMFSVSSGGVLAFRNGANTAVSGQVQMTWFDRQGKVLGTFGEPTVEQGLTFSPDATKAAAVMRGDGQTGGDVWLLDFVRGVRTRLTFRQTAVGYLAWSPDGSRIAFAAGTTPDTIYEKAADGAGEEKELYTKAGEGKIPTSWSPDGRFLLYTTTPKPKTGYDVWILSLADRKPKLLLGTETAEYLAAFSPDGRWIAYLSNESGRLEVYVRPFVTSGGNPAFGEGKWQVSRDGAVAATPRWRGDGKELFFVSTNDDLMAVDVNGAGPAFQIGIPHKLFSMGLATTGDVTPDGKRFLVGIVPGQNGQSTNTPITVVLNWQADLKK